MCCRVVWTLEPLYLLYTTPIMRYLETEWRISFNQNNTIDPPNLHNLVSTTIYPPSHPIKNIQGSKIIIVDIPYPSPISRYCCVVLLVLTKYGDIFKSREKYVGSDLIYNSVCFTETKCQTITDRIISTHGATLLFFIELCFFYGNFLP